MSEETSQMFEAIGIAITRWSFVESELFSVYAVCAGDVAMLPGGGLALGDIGVHTAVFYSVENFRGKLGLVEGALRARLRHHADDLIADWVKLSKKINELSRRRNQLAHYTVLPGAESHDTFVGFPPRLVPPHGSPGYWAETGIQPSRKTISLHHVRQLETAFCLLEGKIRDFSRKIVSHEGLFDIYVQQLLHRIQSHARTSRSRSDTLSRALSSFQ